MQLFAHRSTQSRISIAVALACCLFFLANPAASSDPERVWSQERLALNSDGSPTPSLFVQAGELDGLTTFDRPLTADVTLRVETNVAEPLERGLDDLAGAVAAGWQHTRDRLGFAPRGDILLYLIEVDEVPTSYRFEAQGALGSRFGEIRLAWIPQNAPIFGEGMPADLAELVFDTLPHELVHDQLDQIPMLRQELSRGPNPGTRWFVEGLCELVAKEFSAKAAPATWARMVQMRRPEHAPALLDATAVLLDWSQTGTTPQRESDLYGASMLMLCAWTNVRDLDVLVQRMQTADGPVDGRRLLAWMREDLGQPNSGLLTLARAEALQLLGDLQAQEDQASFRGRFLAR